MVDLKFVRFQAEDYALYEAWSEEDEINHWLGSATIEWRDYILATQESFVWMIYDREDPVANLEVDLLEDDASQAQVSYMVPQVLGDRDTGDESSRVFLNSLSFRTSDGFMPS